MVDDSLRPGSLYDELMRLRDLQRAQQDGALWVVRGRDLLWERNPQGLMKWYLHPAITGTAIRTLIAYVQEIPPGSRSGKQQRQGGVVMYILEGRGATVIDGAEFPWEAGDVLQLPLKERGIVFQHFNRDPERPARFIACEANFVDTLGVDRGAGFEQLEPAPEYEKPAPSGGGHPRVGGRPRGEWERR